jgi:hypothetical protein
MTPLVEAAKAVGVRHRANREGDMVLYGPECGTEGADHGRGAEVSLVSENDYTAIGHDDDGDYRNLGSFTSAKAALEAALAFVRQR